jgi:biotin carboxylase
MQKIFLLLGNDLLNKFSPHILEIDPEVTVIECGNLPSKKKLHLYLKKGAEFETIIEFTKNKNVVGIINRADYYENLHGRLVDYFELPGPSFASINQVGNKANLHLLMENLNLQLFRPRTIICQLTEVAELLKNIQFPVMIKPFVGAHSRGVTKLESVDDFNKIYSQLYEHFLDELASENPNNKIVLIEEYLPGKQVTPICYVDKKSKVHFISLVKITNARDLKQDHYQIIYRTTPSNVKESIQQKMKFVLQKVAKASLLKETFLDPEFFVDGDNIYLIEINVRMGGFRQELAKPAFDIDLEKMITQLAMNQEVDDQFNVIGSASACEIWEQQSGVIKKLKLPKSKHIAHIKLNFKPGDYYQAPPIGNKALGSFYIRASEKSLTIAKNLRSKVIIEFESTNKKD